MSVPTWMCGLEQISSLLCGPQSQYRGDQLCTCKGPCLSSIPWFSWQSGRNPILSLGLFRGSLAKTSELSLEQRHTETWDLREGTFVVSSQTQKWEFSQDTNRPVPSISRVSGFSIPPTSLSQKMKHMDFPLECLQFLNKDSPKDVRRPEPCLQRATCQIEYFPLWSPGQSWGTTELKSWFGSCFQEDNFKHVIYVRILRCWCYKGT